MRSYRVVLALGSASPREPKVRFTSRFRRWTPYRVGEFNEESARIEAQLLVIKEDIQRRRFSDAPTSIGLRLRRLEITRRLLFRQIDVADRMCRIRPPLSKMFNQLVGDDDTGDAERAERLLESKELADAPINLEKVVDLFHLYREIRDGLPPSSGPNEEDGRHDQGVA